MASFSTSPSTEDIIVPPKFISVIRDFTTDLTSTFPEYSILWRKWINDEVAEKDIMKLFKYCTEVYPERFFDILYQNADIFDEESETNTRFLPAVEFKILYHCEGVSDTTRAAIWKYLQLILMTVINSVRDKSAFGEAANIFEGVDEEQLQGKLKETLADITSFFQNLNPEDEQEGVSAGADTDTDAPKAEELHDHLKGLFDGKIGSLAKELAQELSGDVENMFSDEQAEDVKSTGDLINKMIKNPKKIMGLMKTISGKLQQKMKSGEISEEEIMKEASEIMGKMKGMKGMGNMGDMFKNIAKGMGGAGAGINTGAIQQMQRQMATKERMRAKLETKHIERKSSNSAVFKVEGEEEVQQYSVAPVQNILSDKELEDMFSAKETKKPKKKSGKSKK